MKAKADAARRKAPKPAAASDAESDAGSDAPSDGEGLGSDDDDVEFDLSGVDPSLLGILGGDDSSGPETAPHRMKQSILTTWTPPAQAGLDNSLDGLELAKQRMSEAVVLAIAA